jgi:hypothetical protein
MDEYVKGRTLHGNSVYVGGHDGDMALYFFDKSWVVHE